MFPQVRIATEAFVLRVSAGFELVAHVILTDLTPQHKMLILQRKMLHTLPKYSKHKNEGISIGRPPSDCAQVAQFFYF